MVRLVAAKCPTCGASLQVDVEQAIASCGHCNTSAFVKTNQRPVTQQALQQRVPVIDTTSKLALPLILGLAAAGVCAASVGVFLTAAPAAQPSAVPPPASAAPSTPSTPVVEPPAVVAPTETEPPVAPPAELVAPRSASRLSIGAVTVSGHVAPDVVQRIIRQNFARFRMCYEQMPVKAAGRISTRFVIGRDGSVSVASDAGSSLNDAELQSCVLRAYRGLSFPQPSSGIATVVSPLMFTP